AARWIVHSQAAIAVRIDGESHTSPYTRATHKSSMRSVRLVRRNRQTTSCPDIIRSRTTYEPMKPLPPVTKTFIAASANHQLVECLDRRVDLLGRVVRVQGEATCTRP